MTTDRNKLLELAKEAGLDRMPGHLPAWADNLERFAALVLSAAQAEREPIGWLEKSASLDAWFFAHSKNPKAETKPLYTAPPSSDQVWNETLTKALRFYADGLRDDGSVAKVALWAVRTQSASGAGDELPPLPASTHCQPYPGPSDAAYTADQVREIQREAYELGLSRAKQAAQSAQVPAAWMVVFETETGVTVDPKEAQLWRHEGYDVAPLYAAPQPNYFSSKNAQGGDK